MKNRIVPAIAGVMLYASNPAVANEAQIEQLQQELEALKQQVSQLQQQPASKPLSTSQSSFNPSISIVLDGQYTRLENDAEDYELPGFMLGGEAGLPEAGLGIGHTEIVASANIDDKFYGQMTLALAEHEGEVELEVEEAYIETISLPGGLSIRAGRFFSGIGYINQQHNHAWNFADAPLVYAGLWGDKYIDDGLRLNWVAPTDTFIELGAEALSRGGFPAGGERSGHIGAQVYYLNIGGDIDNESSWLLGLSHFEADVDHRESGGHDHGAEAEEVPVFAGESKADGISFVYKWAPNGNYKNSAFTLQTEFFSREEIGHVELEGSDPFEETELEGEQEGYYIQMVYKFHPQWATGVRYDSLSSNNQGEDADVLEEAGLDDEGIDPQRTSFMIAWLPSEFSRLRLQFNQDESYEEKDNQIILQYTMSFGAHGAHSF